MIYLEKFLFPSIEDDYVPPENQLGSFYDDNCYPYHILYDIGLFRLDFEPLTIFYGGNGSGKSTIINIIGEKLRAVRHSLFNTSPHFREYVAKCQYIAPKDLTGEPVFEGQRNETAKYNVSQVTTVITSDDIFHWMLDMRLENDKKLQKSRFLFEDYYYAKNSPLPKHLNFETGYNVEKFKERFELKKAREGKRSSFNKYLLKTLGKMARGFSNGETALMKLSELIETPGLYLLDEPENSMSCEFQQKLSAIVGYLSKYGDCQFIISTHSPFLLSLPNAKIYNLDVNPVNVSRWWELENMHRYFNLFFDAKDEFLKFPKS